MKRVGILGGTFDPFHLGHLSIAIESYRQLQLNEIWIIPTGKSPHKSDKQVTSDDIRVEMICAAIKPYPYMKCITYEIEKKETCYTSETLTELSTLNPQVEFYYIVGGDSFCSLDRWHDPETIFDFAHIVCAFRPTSEKGILLSKAEYLRRTYQAKVTLIHNEGLPISSTMIRETINANGSISKMVPKAVEDIIYEKQLYRH